MVRPHGEHGPRPGSLLAQIEDADGGSRLGELDEHAGRGAGMEERDTFPFGAEPGGLVDQPDAGGAAASERTVEVVDGEADVMDSGTAFGDELADGGFRMLGLEQLDEGVTGGEAGDAGTIRVVELDLREVEEIAVEGEDLVERAHGDPNVGDARGTAGNVGHVSALVKRGAGAEF